MPRLAISVCLGLLVLCAGALQPRAEQFQPGQSEVSKTKPATPAPGPALDALPQAPVAPGSAAAAPPPSPIEDFLRQDQAGAPNPEQPAISDAEQTGAVESAPPDINQPATGEQPAVPEAAPAETVPPAGSNKVTLQQMIGQMIIVGFVGTSPNDPGVAAVAAEIKNGTVGGVMLLARNVRSPQQVRALNDYLRNAGGRTVPFISVDQEGGKVQRLTPGNGHRAYPSPAQIGKLDGTDATARAYEVYSQLAGELARDGFNLNFGPGVDLNVNPSNPIIGRLGRSYGSDPKKVVGYAASFAAAHNQAHILTAAKHFPGHGSSKTDSHVSFTDITDTWKPVELEPFKAMTGNVDMLMIGHLYHPEFSDGPGVPASLSKKAIDYARSEIGFKGVIVSDDMEMGALREHFSFEERIVRAVKAGTDLLIFANLRPAPQIGLGAKINGVILRAVQAKKIPPAQIEQSYRRIMVLKRSLATKQSAAN